VDAALDTLLTALYVKIDDMLVKDRRAGHPVRLSQSELVCLAVAQALLGFHSEHRWIRFARAACCESAGAVCGGVVTAGGSGTARALRTIESTISTEPTNATAGHPLSSSPDRP
jgi:hypothetical protein